MARTEMDDFKGEDGKIDWGAYKQAQVDSGEDCQKCGSFLMFPKGYPTLCTSCKKAEGTEEIWHDSFVRCPKCGYMWDPMVCEDYHLLSDGDHDAFCCECDHEFAMGTSVSFSFKSPARIQEEEPEPVEEEEDDPETVQEVENSES